MVTQKNPDENVNHLPSAAPQSVVDGTHHIASGDNNDINNKRCALCIYFCFVLFLHVLTQKVFVCFAFDFI